MGGGGGGVGSEVVVMNFQVYFQRRRGIINQPVALMQSTIPQRCPFKHLESASLSNGLIWNFFYAFRQASTSATY